MAMRKTPLSMGIALTVAIGLLAVGYLSLSRGLTGGGMKLKPSPFGPEPSMRIRHGSEFSLEAAVGHARPATRVRWEDVAKPLSEPPSPERTRKLQSALNALVPEADDFAPYLYAVGLATADSLRQGLRKPGSQDEKTLENLAYLTHPFARYVHGVLALTLGRPELAAQSFHAATDAAPDFAFAWCGLGYAHLTTKNAALATPCFQKAIGIMESDTAHYPYGKRIDGHALRDLPLVERPPYGGLAQAYLLGGEVDTAAQIFAYAEERGFGDGQLALARAWWWELKGQIPKARVIYDSLGRVYPAWYALQRLRGSLGLKGGLDADGRQALFAIRTLDPLVQAYPKNAPLRLALARSYVQRGLFGLAVAQLDSGLALDPTLVGAEELRRKAYGQWVNEEGVAALAKPAAQPSGTASPGSEGVIIPSTLALLGTYAVPWGAASLKLRSAYPDKTFRKTPKGNLTEAFTFDGLRYENVSVFRHDSLWGILALVTDTGDNHYDVFGRMIRMKTKISGEGKGTGEATCPGYRSFQGAIWENDDTFEFMAQFQGKENEVRLARIARADLPYDRRLCDMVSYLDRDFWENPGVAKKRRRPEAALRQTGRPAPRPTHDQAGQAQVRSMPGDRGIITITESQPNAGKRPAKRPNIKPLPETSGGGTPIITPASPGFHIDPESEPTDPNDLETLGAGEGDADSP